MITMAGDLSSKLTGIVIAKIDGAHIERMRSVPILRPYYDVSELGFMKTKKHLPSKNNTETYNTWWTKGETHISKSEKKKRDVLVRDKDNLNAMFSMSRDISELVGGIRPNLIVYEKNSTFNSPLTSSLLAKVAGTLIGISANYNIPVEEYRVQTIRKRYHPEKLVIEFAKGKTKEQMMTYPDITKAAFRELMQNKYGKYGLDLKTDDESDACVVFDYWFEEIYLKGLQNGKSNY